MGMKPADHMAVTKLVMPAKLAAFRPEIYLSYPAATRDPAVFADPLRFDVTRENAARHIAFGGGPLFCLGARLARYQLQALLMEILARIPNIRPDGTMEMMKSIWFNAIIRMPEAITAEN